MGWKMGERGLEPFVLGRSMNWGTFFAVLLIIVAASWCAGYALACVAVLAMGR